MQANYGYIALFVIAAILFALVMVLTPVILRLIGIVPHKPNPTKTSIYECGMETVGKTWVQFNFRYYYYALIFVALDVLALFIYPWAVELFIFILIIAVGWVYAWKKKVLEWK